MIFCPKCGLRNEDNAKKCIACGSEIKQRPYRFAGQQKEETREGMAKSTKLLIIAGIILVAGLGLTYGVILKSGEISTPPQVSSPAAENTSSKTNSKPIWHKITTFTGNSEDSRTVNIKGNQFKVIMSATPKVSYDINAFSVDVLKGEAGIATGTINWSATEKPTRKEHVVQVKEGKGPYTIKIIPSDIASWSVTVWDYY